MAITRTFSDYKDSVVAATTTNITLSGGAPNSVDGVSLALADRVLVKNQNTASENGIYRVTTLGTGSNGTWQRAGDFNDYRQISPGAFTFVEKGSVNGNSYYYINGGEPNVTLGTTSITFSNLYSVDGGNTSFNSNVNIAGNLTVVGNIVTNSYETVTLTEYANVLTVTGNINLTNSGNINIGAGGNIYMGSTAIPRYRSGNTAPSSPNLGDTWYQGNTDILYEYIQDANGNNYWFDISSNPSSFGNLTVANILTLNGNLTLPVTSLQLTGGTSGYVLSTTDGLGTLTWTAISATAGGSNTMVQFSNSGSIGGSTYLQYNYVSGNLVSNSTTTSTNTTTGAIVTPSLGVSGNVNANAFYSNYYLYSNGSTITTPAGGGNTMVQFNDGSNFSGATFLQYNKTSGNLVSNSTTTSTSTTTGALVVGGGVGIGGNINAAGYIVANGAFNESATTPGVYIGNLNATARIGFFNGNASANWQIDNSLGTFRWYTPGTTRMSIDYGGNLTLPGAMFITNNSVSTSTTTGALTVSGGVGVTGNLYVGGNLSVGGNTTFINAQTITTTDTIAAPALNAGTIGNSGATFNGGTANFVTVNGTSLLATTIGNTASAINGNLITASAIYAGTIGNSGATFNGGTANFVTINATNMYATTIGNNGTSGASFNIKQISNLNTDSSASSFKITNYAGLTRISSAGTTSNTLALQREAVTVQGQPSSTDYNIEFWSGTNGANLTAKVSANTFVTYGPILPGSNAQVNIGSTSSQYFNTIYAVSFVGTSTTAKYADLAEMYKSDSYYVPGTVVIFGGDSDITISTTTHDTRIAGVISTNPAYLMNDNFETPNWLPVALTGRVPCKVRGPVEKGDILVSSDEPGIAQRLDKSKYEIGCVLGKSLDIIKDNSVHKIEVVVGRF